MSHLQKESCILKSDRGHYDEFSDDKGARTNMSASPRARRLAKRIGEIVAVTLDREIKDPRLEFVTITDVRVTGDLHDATIYYTARGASLDDEPNHAEIKEALESAKGQLRSKVGAGTGVRFTPTLTFELDEVPDQARRMEELLAKARAADAATAAVRENATPVGGENPYKED